MITIRFAPVFGWLVDMWLNIFKWSINAIFKLITSSTFLSSCVYSCRISDIFHKMDLSLPCVRLCLDAGALGRGHGLDRGQEPSCRSTPLQHANRCTTSRHIHTRAHLMVSIKTTVLKGHHRAIIVTPANQKRGMANLPNANCFIITI